MGRVCTGKDFETGLWKKGSVFHAWCKYCVKAKIIDSWTDAGLSGCQQRSGVWERAGSPRVSHCIAAQWIVFPESCVSERWDTNESATWLPGSRDHDVRSPTTANVMQRCRISHLWNVISAQLCPRSTFIHLLTLLSYSGGLIWVSLRCTLPSCCMSVGYTTIWNV